MLMISKRDEALELAKEALEYITLPPVGREQARVRASEALDAINELDKPGRMWRRFIKAIITEWRATPYDN